MPKMTASQRKTILHKPDSLVIRNHEDFYLALNPDLPNIMVMDNIGKKFFELCDGKHSQETIITKILNEHEGEASRDELQAFAMSMRSAGFLFLQPPEPPRRIERDLDKLRKLYFHITNACNLRCRHCYIEASKPSVNELTTSEAIKMTCDFARLGAEQLIITGGEPFLRRQTLLEVCRKANEAGIRILIETNGTLISDDDVTMCKKYDVELGVSLDGSTRETNDYVRGAGNYDKTIEGIERLVDADVKVRIGMTLMKPNVKEAESIVSLARNLRVPAVSVSFVREMGRAKTDKSLLLDLGEMYTAILNMWRKAEEAGISTQLQDQFKSFEKLARTDMCGAGTETLLVSPTGDIYPCNMFLEFDEFKAGNLRRQSLEDIWKSSEALKVFRHLSVLDVEGCNHCCLKFICGFCPAESYRDHRSFNKKSSLCPLYEKICWMLIDQYAEKMWREQ